MILSSNRFQERIYGNLWVLFIPLRPALSRSTCCALGLGHAGPWSADGWSSLVTQVSAQMQLPPWGLPFLTYLNFHPSSHSHLTLFPLPCFILVVILIRDLLFFFFKIFLMWTIFKSLLNLLQYCRCPMFWFFGREACGILAPWPGIKPSPSALEGEVLTTGPPGKSQGSATTLYLYVSDLCVNYCLPV